MSIKKEIFKSILDKFETEELRAYCEDMIEEMDDEIFRIPASTSLKYHSPSQCEPGGQIKHVLMSCQILNYILELEYIQNKFPKPKQRDCLRIAMCLHDSLKLGTNGSKYTVHEHPILAGEWIVNTTVEHDIDIRLKKYLQKLVGSHMGQWRTSNRSSVTLPAIEGDDQFLVHLGDYLGSRVNLDMTYSQETINSIKQMISGKE